MGKRTPEIIDEILGRVAKGESINKICGKDRDDWLPSQAAWHQWLCDDADLVEKYARACEDRAACIFEDMLDIADDALRDFRVSDKGPVFDAEHVQRARLRIDTRKWMLARMAPKKYGDKIEIGGAGPGGAIVTRTARDLTDDELAAMLDKP